MQSTAPLLFLFLIFLYFLPGFVASIRNSPHALPIWIFNVFLGWTILFWVIALVWATMPIAANKPPYPKG